MTPVVRASALGLAACLCAVGSAAHAASNVQVDPSVLDELGPPSKADTGGPVVLTPPRRETGPAETKPAVEAKPAGAATTAVEKATPATPSGTTQTTPPAERATKVATTGPAEPKRTAEPAAATTGGGGNRIVFAKGSADLPKAADGVLAPLVKALAADPKALLSVEAYAESGEAGAESARRLALSRGLAVRRYLESHGIAGARALIDARSAEVGGGPADRVDLAIAKN
jgi:outer membrane protein OmpA-like peptidoglycan-associated protein